MASTSDDEVKELNRFFHQAGNGGWPGPQLRDSELIDCMSSST